MAIRTYKVTLDSKNTLAPEPVYLRQGDKTGAVVIDATLMDNGAPISIDGLTPMFKANTADGQAVIADSTGFNIVNASGGEFTYQVPSQLGSVPGKIKIAYFSFSDSSGYQSTFNVVFAVEKAADMTQESAKDWASNLNDIINQYNQWANDAHSSWESFVNENKNIIENIDPGGKILSELIDARHPANSDKVYETIGERMDAADQASKAIADDVDISSNRAILAFLNSQVNEIGGLIPQYYRDKLATFADIPADNFNVGFITDNHHQLSSYAPNSLAHYAYMAAASRIVSLQAIIAGGDNTNGWYGHDQKIIETKQVTSVLFNRTNPDTDVFFEMGNHDSGIGQNGNKTPATTLSETEINDLYQSRSRIYDEVRDGDSLYGYKDYPDKKVRLIWLNSFDLPYTLNADGTFKYNFLTQSAYRNDQLNWLASSALILPNNDWQVMIFTHCPLPGTFDVAAGQSIVQINSTSLVKILNAFQAGVPLVVSDDDPDFPVVVNADYTAQGKGTIIALISGHIHADGQMVYEGINCIETAASLCYFGDASRVKNTETEDCWDIFSIDTAARKIHAYRFGSGSDRDFIY